MKGKQIAALPFRTKSAKLRILLITTRGKRRWSVPKGWPMRRKQPHRAAAVEAYEEAGLLGRISAKAIGRFKHSKGKGKHKRVLDVTLFPLKVKKRHKHWPERGQRRAVWLRPSEAARRVDRPELRRLLRRFAREQATRH
jgi:8-oxo-dGTP pyrophosphatase MutT (NUDIX family)